MEAEEMLELLPVAVGWAWPRGLEEILHSIKDAPSGDSLFPRMLNMRELLAPGDHLAQDAGPGFAHYLDHLLSPEDRRRWFRETLPYLSGLLLDLPSMLSAHFSRSPRHLRLRLLPAQRHGAVLLPQRLVAALVACSFFCLFPRRRRHALRLPPIINLDSLFHSLYRSGSPALQHKLHCLLHYFHRAASSSSSGAVSFHRKVVPSPVPPPRFWAQSAHPLCAVEVHTRGFIEDHPMEALQVDFANEYLGGGALHRGCVQEEIRFMINPELIAGMLFLPRMQDNEAIEIVGAERFSSYTGYASSFRFAGDHVDATGLDSFNRRRTRIIAIDALCNPGMRQYKLDCILREINKAFCGFSDQTESEHFQRLLSGTGPQQALLGHSDQHGTDMDTATGCNFKSDESPSTCVAFGREDEESVSSVGGSIGIATGNWGCGAFGGDPELKAMIQWLAASQAVRPVIAYYTFGIKELRDLEQVSQWILLHKWTVGDLWNILVEYSSQRHKGEAKMGFFAWLLPFLNSSHEIEQFRRM